MSAIGGILGLKGGASGTGFDNPQGAPIVSQTDRGQLDVANDASNQALQSQRDLLGALSGVNGIQNQQNTFTGLGNLSGQLGQIASGQGPNPAQAMLNQQTGANISNQAALMAGQRGVGANTGLLARQAAQQGGALQQQAVGQGATMQAQQSLGALGQQAGVMGQMGNIAGSQVGNQMAQTNAAAQARMAQQGQLLNAMGQTNNAAVSNQSSINSANAALAGTQMQGQQGMIGGILNGAGAAIGLSGGGVVGYAAGGTAGPQSSFGQFLNVVSAPGDMSAQAAAYPTGPNQGAEKLKDALSGMGKSSPADPESASTQLSGLGGDGLTPSSGLSSVGAMTPMTAFSSGGSVDVVLSPGEKVVAPNKVGEAAGGEVQAKTVPGQAKVSGDSYSNDVVKTKLPAGSIVVPRSKAKNEKSAADFVRKTLAKRGPK